MAKPVMKLTAGSLPLKSCPSSGRQQHHLGSLRREMATPTQHGRASRHAVNRGTYVHSRVRVQTLTRGMGTQHSKSVSSGAAGTTRKQQLQQVDVLRNMGISRHFAAEIKCILDMTYSCWLQRDDEIMLDVETCAMAFRILRMNGYNVSSDELYHVAEASWFHTSLEGYLNDTRSLLELHKASKVSISEEESILDSIGSWSGCLLKEQLRSGALHRTPLIREIVAAIFRWNMLWNVLSTPHWIVLSTGGTLKFRFHTHRAPGAKSIVPVSFLFHREELRHLDRWDEHHKLDFYSEQVEIVFSAIYTSVNELGAHASLLQDRDVTKHLVEIVMGGSAEIYDDRGPIVLPALYFVGPKISESVVKDPEYNELFRLMSTCGRLLNDVQTYEREYEEGKVNSVSLLVLQNGGSMSIQEARREIQKPIDTCRRDLLSLVLRKEGAVPRPCKELFWKMCKVCYFFYSRGDAFSSPEEKAREVDAVVNLPLQLKGSNASLLHVVL
ncbi:hypothetical protein HU200_013289 [Digitaria exilis]|uniref:Terpene synthase N-terminal domain-containing protein n=1 Tax=Digitaria exilis TaxID=1010633 RepID=A0A835KL66_9POAL|nr:hypothetical protein HU200_013289 [Digitaria exilis]